MPIKIRTQNKNLQTLKYIYKKGLKEELLICIMRNYNWETGKRLRNLKFAHCLHIVQSLFPRPKETLKGQQFFTPMVEIAGYNCIKSKQETFFITEFLKRGEGTLEKKMQHLVVTMLKNKHVILKRNKFIDILYKWKLVSKVSQATSRQWANLNVERLFYSIALGKKMEKKKKKSWLHLREH